MFVWLVVEVREPWLRSTLQEGWPDWIAAIFAFCGVVLFIANSSDDRYDQGNRTIALISLSLLSIAAATKIHYGLFAAVIFLKLCVDAIKYLRRDEATKLIVLAAAIALIFAASYIVYYAHLADPQLPVHPRTMSERLSHAFKLFNSNFSLPFRILVIAGLAASPFVKGVRWLALPLIVGFISWASLFSYDLRNLLGMLDKRDHSALRSSPPLRNNSQHSRQATMEIGGRRRRGWCGRALRGLDPAAGNG